MENFGDYITNEYAILKQILNNLTLTDLLTARKVCRGWHKCALHILRHVSSAGSPHFLYTDQLFHDNEAEHWDKLRIIPDIMIRFSKHGGGGGVEPDDDHRNQCWASLLRDADDGEQLEPDEGSDLLEPDEEIIRKLDEECGLRPPTGLIDFSCDGTIGFVPKHALIRRSLNATTKVLRCKCPFGGFDHTMTNFEKQYVFSLGKSSSALVLPRMPGVHYDVVKFYVEDQKICMESYPEKPPWFDLPVKCLLLLDCRLRNAQVIKSLRMFLDFFKVNDNTCLAVGGGRLRGGKSWPRGRRKAEVRAHMYAVVVRGRNVAANSFMIKPHCATLEQIDAELAAFASVVGPVSNGSKRLAVMAQCIDRVRVDVGNSLENREAQIIGKHFPNVPLFGFVAKGELGYSTDVHSNDEPPAKRMKSKPSLFINYQSTSLIVLTFKTES